MRKCNNISTFASCISDKFLKFSVYELLKFCHISKNNTRCCVLHVPSKTLFWLHIYTHIHIYTHTHTHTHAHTHTHTRTHANTHADLNFTIFWKDREIKYTRIWDNDGPQNLIHRNSSFLMKTSDLRKLLGKLREAN